MGYGVYMIYWELMDSGVNGVLLAHLWPGVLSYVIYDFR